MKIHLEVRQIRRAVFMPWFRGLKARRPEVFAVAKWPIAALATAALVTARALMHLGYLGARLHDWLGLAE